MNKFDRLLKKMQKRIASQGKKLIVVASDEDQKRMVREMMNYSSENWDYKNRFTMVGDTVDNGYEFFLGVKKKDEMEAANS